MPAATVGTMLASHGRAAWNTPPPSAGVFCCNTQSPGEKLAFLLGSCHTDIPSLALSSITHLCHAAAVLRTASTLETAWNTLNVFFFSEAFSRKEFLASLLGCWEQAMAPPPPAPTLASWASQRYYPGIIAWTFPGAMLLCI